MKAEIKSPHSILDKYTALLDISCRLNLERNFDQLLKLIADEATKHVDAERATIFILDKEKGNSGRRLRLVYPTPFGLTRVSESPGPF